MNETQGWPVGEQPPTQLVDFFKFADLLPQLVWTATDRGIVDYYNSRISDYDPRVGLAAGDFDWLRFLHPDDLAPTLATWQAAQRTGSYSCEHRLRMADGSWRWHLSCAHRNDDRGLGARWYGTAIDIDEHRRTAEALHQSSERYRTLFETMDEGFCVVEVIFDEQERAVDYRFLETNPAFERATGLYAATGKTARQLVPNLEEYWFETYGKIVLTGKARRFEDGSEAMGRWFDVYAFPVGEPAARQVAILFNNITQRKVIEERLLHSEERFRLTFEQAPVGIGQTTSTGQLELVNPAFCRILGYTEAELIGRNISELKVEKAEPGSALAGAQGTTLPPMPLETCYRRKDGSLVWTNQTGSVVADSQGHTRFALTIIEDISERKRAEAALHDHEALLRLVNERFLLAEEASNGWVYDFDMQRGTAERSAGLYRILGYEPDEVSPAVEWWHGLLHPDDLHLVDLAASSRRRLDEFSEVEYRIRHRAGHYVHVLDRSRLIRNRTGQPVRMVGITVDISARKQAELHQQFLNELSLQLRLLSDPDQIMTQLVTSLGQHLQVTACRINEVDLANQQFKVQADRGTAGTVATGVFPLTELAPPPILAELTAGCTVAVTNTSTDARTAPFVANYQSDQVTAFVGVPMFRHQQWSATLSVKQQGERSWQRHEIQLLEAIANLFWPLLEKAYAEQALRRSEQQLRAIFDQVTVGMVNYDVQGRIRLVNDYFCELVGYSRAELYGQGWYDITHPDDLAYNAHQYALLAAGGVNFTIEKRYIHQAGHPVWVHKSVSALRDAQGQIYGIIAVVLDINERKAAENDLHFLADLAEQIRLAESPEQLLAKAVDRLGEHLGVGRCFIFERATSADLGIIRHQYSPNLPPVAAEFRLSTYSTSTGAELSAGHTVVNCDAQLDPRTAALYAQSYAPTQERAYVGVPLLRAGQLVAVLSVTTAEPRRWQPREIRLLETVGERIWLAVEKLRLDTSLRQSEERYRALFEHASDAIFIANDEGIYQDVNAAACALSGYSHHELVGRHIRDLTPPAAYRQLDEDRQRLLDGQSQINEWWLLRQDQTIVPIEVSVKRLPDGRWQAFVRDITERQRLLRELHQLNATLEERVEERTQQLEQKNLELERSNRELDQFAYVASHDLRAPLRAITNLASWISQDALAVLPPASQTHLEKLRGRVKRMERLLDDLLLFSRAGRIHSHPERVDTAGLVYDVWELLSPPPGFTLTCTEPLPVLRTERVPLETVLRNLIGNAIKHHQRTDGHIVVTGQINGSWVEFQVSDDGPGIDAQYHAKIFEMFQTLKPRDQVEGSGMGLAVVKKLVESYGGTIKIESSPGQGATFAFTWPKT